MTKADLIGAKEFAERLGVSVRALRERMIPAGTVPVPIYLTEKRRRKPKWVRAAIDKWIADGCPQPGGTE